MGRYEFTGPSDSSDHDWEGGLEGARLYLGGAGLYVALFLTGLETMIIGTTLVSITDDLQGFGKSSWIITSYLLTYAGFLMLWSKAGDIWGVRPTLLTSVALFTAFSGGCGGAQSLSQLIICRAFQGMGAAGIYGLVIFSLIRMVPKKDYATVTGVWDCGLVGIGHGPLVRGCNHTTWGLALGISPKGPSSFWTRQGVLLRQIDLVGAFLVLGTSVFMVAALQEGNYDFGWDSSAVIIFFVLSGLCFPLFLWWQWFLSRRDLASQPILPWRLLVNRLFVGAILKYTQWVSNHGRKLDAGVQLLAFAVSVPAGMMFCSIVASRYPLPLVYLGIAGICLQVVGDFLYSSIPSETQIWRGQFAYLVLAGFGNGLAFGTFYSMLPLVVTIADQSISIGTGFQLRMLGGALGIAAATAILHSYTRSHLASFLPANEVDALAISSQIIDTLTPEMQVWVREIYAEAYSEQMKLVGGFSAAQVLAVGLVWKRNNVRIVK
ncbi:hypothetical protein ABHI18_002324 [Aspergillus niger]